MCIKHVRTCLKHNLMQRVDACVILKIYTNLKFVGLLDQLATDPGFNTLFKYVVLETGAIILFYLQLLIARR